MPNLSSVPDEAHTEPRPAESATPKRRKSRKVSNPTSPPIPAEAADTLPDWPEFIRNSSPGDVERRFAKEAAAILASEPVVANNYACVALLQPERSIGQFELDQIFAALAKSNPDSAKDVLLLLLSPGGGIEPAYQISKVCKTSAKDKFVVCIPRQAKSAATLIALGADEIHMSLLGHLGPIDPQVQGLPALGVSQALETLAVLVERHPGSANMFATYLQNSVRIEQIGYYERICESAVQYAERLLSSKSALPKPAAEIARELVHEYKDHGFVIDLAEAMEHLGDTWIKVATPEVMAAERLYRLFERVNLFLGFYKSKVLWIAGSVSEGIFIFDRPKTRGA